MKPLLVHQDCSRVGAQFRCPPQELVVLVAAGEIERGAAPQGVVRRDVRPNQTVAGGCVPENQYNRKKTLVWIILAIVLTHQIKRSKCILVYIPHSKVTNMYVHNVVGTERYTTSTTNMYHNKHRFHVQRMVQRRHPVQNGC